MTLSEQAYVAIEDMIIHSDIPSGTYVTEAQLVERVGLGRTPIREALQRLSREHMVHIRPRMGIYIPVIDYETELRILEVRRELDAVSVKLAARRASAEQRREMHQMAELLATMELDLKKYAETVRETHRLLAASSRNTYLIESMLPLQNLSRRYWLSNMVDARKEIKTSSDCHLRMLRGAADGHAEAAEAAAYDLNDYLVDYATRSAQLS